MNGVPSRPRPSPSTIPEHDDQPASDSSSSSADSLASVNTVRPSSSEYPAVQPIWPTYFAQEFFLDKVDDGQHATYHVYLNPPTDRNKGPLFICHHGAGASGLSFALFAQQLKSRLPEAGVLCLEARAHGSVVTKPNNDAQILDFSPETLAADASTMIDLTKQRMGWQELPPTVLVGHSMGGGVVTELAASNALGNCLIGFAVLDVVEGSALEALGHMRTYLASRPSTFSNIDEAVDWHVRSRVIRNRESAEISVPGLFMQLPSGRYTWKLDYGATEPYWESWFTGMSQKFLRGRGAKILMLAGTDRLDKDLMIGQMQGKFQLVVLPEAGHFIQEDVPDRTAELLAEFFKRNDRSTLVLPPKVSDLIAQGKKV